MKLNNDRYEILTPNGFVDFLGIQKLKKKTIEIFFEGGLTLRGSHNHQIYDYDNEPILLKNIKKGQKIKSHDGFLIVDSVKKYEYKTNVYDVVDAGELHLYYTNGIISHNCDFLGSGDSVISSTIQDNIRNNMIREPKEKYMDGLLWQWKDPIIGHRYICANDVSRGDSEDYSSMCIIDFDTMEQVVEYVGKIPPDTFADVIYRWASMYQAFVVVDITGGMGVATSRKLQEYNYKNVYIDGVNTQNIWEYNAKAMEKIPGLNYNNKRTQIIAALEENLRKGFQVRSSRLLDEFNTFVYINGRPDHMKGAHDDCIMATAMALYVGDMCFTQLQRNDALNKAMLDSWVVSERSYSPTHYSYGGTFDQVGTMGTNTSKPASQPTLRQYQQYSWLFGKDPNKKKQVD